MAWVADAKRGGEEGLQEQGPKSSRQFITLSTSGSIFLDGGT